MSQGSAASTNYDEPTGWTGWIAFAGIMLVVGGTLNAFYGLIALIDNDWAYWADADTLFTSLTAWGWGHILVGLVAVLVGFGLFTGNMAARIFGVIIAAVSLLANFAFLPIAPVWAGTVILIDLLIIWAITVHGREMKEMHQAS